MEKKEWHHFGSEMVCRTSVHHTRIKYQTKIGLPQLEDSFPVKYLALAMATQKATILLQFGSRVVAVNSPRLSLLSAAQIPHLLNRLHDMVIDTPSAFNCTWVPLRLGWNVWTWLICECPGNYSHQAPWPRSENWVEPGLRHRQHPCWNMAAGLQMCLREDRLHIRASSYSPPCPWVLNQPFKTRSGKHNPSIVPVVNLMLRISNFGHHPYMMALNRELDWKRYFAYSIRSDQWLYSTAGNAGSSQDDAYFSEHPTPFFRRNTSNLFSQAFNECNGQPEPIWLASLCW